MCCCDGLIYAKKNHSHSLYETKSDHDADISNLQGQIDAQATTHTDDVAALQAQIDALTTAHNNDVTNLQGQIDDLQGQIDTLQAQVDTLDPIGSITIWAREQYFSGQSTIPDGWLLCDGATVLRVDYPDLFAAISTTFGSTSSSDFKLPDLRSRVPVGRTPFGGYFNDVGETGGETTHTLTTGEMPNHNHPPDTDNGHISFVTRLGAGNAIVNGPSGGLTEMSISSWTGKTGGNGSHNNIQPYIAVNYIIKAL